MRNIQIQETPTLDVARRKARHAPALDYQIGQVNKIPLAHIRAGDNDRTQFDADQLQELADNIKTNGLASPILVRPIQASAPVRFEIVAGERRYRATGLLGWDTIDALARELTDEQADAIMLSENVQRADLDAIDEANAYRKRMSKYDWSANQVAKHGNVNAKRVADRLLLLDCLPEMQTLIRKNQISPSFGEWMAPLDVNRQRIALLYITSTEKPLLREFKALCSRLLAEQNQNALLDLSTLQTQTLIDQAKTDGASQRYQLYNASVGRFPIDAALPEMLRVGTIGESLDAYVQLLMQSDDLHARDAAPIVGRVYDSLVRLGLCFPPHPNKITKTKKRAAS